MVEYVVEEVVLSSRKDERGGFTTEIVGLGERRERVVRCRDCKHAHQSPLADSEKLMCERFDEVFVSPDGFCAWGEPREGE